MKIIKNLIAISILLIVTACSTESPKNNHIKDKNSKFNAFKREYLSAVNRARSTKQDCGEKGIFSSAPALTWNEKLYVAAYEHSFDMATHNSFSHQGTGEKSDVTGDKLGHKSHGGERISAQGYAWHMYGENIGAGTNRTTAKEMVKGFLESDSHCANLMNPKFKELGMAMVENNSTKYRHYWTQSFGTP